MCYEATHSVIGFYCTSKLSVIVIHLFTYLAESESEEESKDGADANHHAEGQLIHWTKSNGGRYQEMADGSWKEYDAENKEIRSLSKIDEDSDIWKSYKTDVHEVLLLDMAAHTVIQIERKYSLHIDFDRLADVPPIMISGLLFHDDSVTEDGVWNYYNE